MGVNLNKTREEKTRLDKNEYEGAMKRIEWVEGLNVVRLLPPFGTKEEAWMKFKQSFNVGPNGKAVIPAFDANCPLKQEIDRLKALEDPVSKERGQAMYPKNRVGFFLIARGTHPQAGEGPLFWNTNQAFVYKDIIALFADPEFGDISDPVKGIDLKITYTEKASNGFSEWKIVPCRESSPLGTPAEIAEWTKEDLFAKYEIGVPSEPEYIRACLEGQEEAYLESLRKNRDASKPTTQSAPASHGPAAPSVKIANPTAKYWAVLNGQTVLSSAQEVAAYIAAGGSNLQMMSEDQSSGWKDEKFFGFYLETPAPAPVPPPPTAPAAPSMPAPPAPATPPPPTLPPVPSAPSAPVVQAPPPVVMPPERIFWVMKNGAVAKVPESELRTMVGAGYNQAAMLEGEQTWSTPAAYGITAAPAALPPVPGVPAPPAGPPMPPPVPQAPPVAGGMSPEDAALQAQIAQLRAAQQSGQQSQVAADLAKQMGAK